MHARMWVAAELRDTTEPGQLPLRTLAVDQWLKTQEMGRWVQVILKGGGQPIITQEHTCRRILAACVIVPAVSIMSSTSTATLPFTSPIRFMTSLTLCALRRLSTMARGASFSFFANPRALQDVPGPAHRPSEPPEAA